MAISSPVINPSPKTRFMSSKANVERHREMMQNDYLQTSLDFALLEYQAQVAVRTPENVAGAGHFRMLGALEFVQTLKTLAESVQVPVSIVRDNLDHQA